MGIKIKLKELLDNRRISRTKLSHMAEMNLHQVNKYYTNNVKRLDAETLAKLCYVLKCELGELIEYEADEEI